MKVTASVLAVVLCGSTVAAFSFSASNPATVVKSRSLFPQPRSQTSTHPWSPSSNNIIGETDSLSSSSVLSAASSTISSVPPSDDSNNKTVNTDGGIFSFNTKYGKINPFAIYYGVTSILLGLPWFVALTACQIFYKVTNNAFDKTKRLPHFFSHIWGICLLRLTRSYPVVEGREGMNSFLKTGRAAMFVANHNSWMDIPFLGVLLGIQTNYKFVSKAELRKVPILGKSIQIGGHVMVDRTNRRSQLMTLKSGIQWLKDGVHLMTFPEGTRSKTGKMLPFKNGAFKMAHKVGAPVVPISIVGSGVAHPHNWMFPRKPSHSCRVVVHDPIESTDKTEQELADAVRQKIIEGLPESQRPTE